MILIGKVKLEQFKQLHPDAIKAIDAWAREVEHMTWSNPHQVRERYASADFPGGNRVIFNIKGNKYRLLARVYYERETVIVSEVGTHEEYSKWRIK